LRYGSKAEKLRQDFKQNLVMIFLSFYTYTVDGKRASKTIDGIVTHHVFVGEELELDKKGEERIEYVYGKRLLSSTYGTYLYNAHGDVVQLVKGEEVISRYDYTAYGSPMGELSEYQNDPNPYRYNGQYYDHESGYIYLRARYYSPKLGRFLNEDPAKSGNNWHVYGEGNPVLHEDPTGLFAIAIVPVIGLLAIVLVGVAAMAVVPKWMLWGLTMAAATAAGGTAVFQRTKEVEAEKKQRQQEVLKEAAVGAAVMSRAQIAMARAAEGTSEATSTKAVDNINENSQHHILQDKHNWSKLVPDPEDPNNWGKVAAIISTVLSNGTEEKYKTVEGVFIKTYEIAGEIVQVAYRVVDGVVKIADAWVR
jgi:RHS repeat-associated protein